MQGNLSFAQSLCRNVQLLFATASAHHNRDDANEDDRLFA
jgi:hypothetical protein